nr:glycosyltransferase [Rhodothalassium salexigens]
MLFSSLFPNAEQPFHGIFVENRLRHLLAESGWQAQVVAPVPWFPFKGRAFGAYGRFARVPAREERHGLSICHPRYPVIPKLGMSVAPRLLYLGARAAVRRAVQSGVPVDLIDAHYFYPDGVAAAMLAREFALPLTITGRGTDLNLIPRYPRCRAQIQWAAETASGLITVCNALADDLAALGVARERVTVLRNGVDATVFRPEPDAAAALRAEHGRPGEAVWLSVGHLIERKGHDLAIRALSLAPEGRLWIVGTGPEEAALRALARQLGLADRVRFLGAFPHDRLAAIYSAADVLILGSTREGWPNVLLESMACGTPVVATAVNGSPEVVRADVAGRVVPERTAAAVAEAVAAVLAQAADGAAVRAYAEDFSWTATSRGQMALFERIIADRRRRSGRPAGQGDPSAYRSEA